MGGVGSAGLPYCTVTQQNQVEEVVPPADDHRDCLATLQPWHEKRGTNYALYIKVVHRGTPVQKWKESGVQETVVLVPRSLWSMKEREEEYPLHQFQSLKPSAKQMMSTSV